MFTSQFGCDDWQDEEKFETLEEAIAFFDAGLPVMGLYPADYGYVEDEAGTTLWKYEE